MSATSAAEPEIFAMRRSQNTYGFEQKSWKKLKIAIEQNGGRVVEVQGSHPATEHDVMYVRDAGVVINDPAIKTPTYVLPLHRHNEGHATTNGRYAGALRNEGEAIAKTVSNEKKLGDSKAKLAVKHIYGTMEGGNVVIDPKRHKIFVGTSIRVCLRDKGPNPPTDADKERYLGFEQRAINELQALLKNPRNAA